MTDFIPRPLLCVMLLTMLLPAPVRSGDRLTWAMCVAHVKANNIDLSLARLQLEEAAAALDKQQSVFYPDVNARASRTVGEQRTDGVTEDREHLSLSLNASYTVFDGFGDRARVSRSEAELFAEMANYDQTVANVEYDLRVAVAEQLFAQERLILERTIAERRTESKRLVELRYEGGREHQGSLLLMQAQQAEAVYRVGEAERSLVLARRRLASLMNLPGEPRFDVDGALQASEPPVPLALEPLAQRTPAYRIAVARRKAAEQGFVVARSERFPKISAGASVAGLGQRDIETREWQAGLNVSLPVFSGHRLSQEVVIAGLQREQAMLSEERAMLQRVDQLQFALNNHHDRYAQMNVQDEYVRAAGVRAQVARAQYAQGLLSFQDWDAIENSLITAQNNQLNSRRAAVLAEAAWLNVMGLATALREAGAEDNAGAGPGDQLRP